MAQSFQTLQDSGVIKPGFAALAASNLQKGMTIEQVLPPNAWTGQPGATNLTSYLNNPVAQIQAQVSGGFQVAQNKATQAGLITGSESSGQLAGIVSAVATAGLNATINAVRQSAGRSGGLISGNVSGPVGGIVNRLFASAQASLTSGNFAANMASTLTGGLNSIASSLNGLSASQGGGSLLNTAKGISGSAFLAIIKSFPNLLPGIPQNLKQIAFNAVRSAQNTGNETSAGVGAGGAISILPNSISTGLGALPGAQKAVSTIVNKSLAALNTVPGTAQSSAAIRQITASVISGQPLGNIAVGLLASLRSPGNTLAAIASTGLPAGAAAALNSAISSLSSGGSVPTKLATVAINTVNRSSLTSLVGSVFGNSKIPIPNFSGNPATTGETPATTGYDTILAEQQAASNATKGAEAALAASNTAKLEYEKALQSLPAGDPQLATLKAQWDAKYAEYVAKINAAIQASA
jgi:hypothetical protein